MKNKALFVTGSIFALLALTHLMRLFYPFQIVIGSFSIPVWLSAFLFVIVGVFSAWIFYAMGSKEKQL